jgi:hypothetical protein
MGTRLTGTGIPVETGNGLRTDHKRENNRGIFVVEQLGIV